MHYVHGTIVLLVWLGLGLFNMWIWQKEKAQASLLMMIGAFAAAAWWIIALFEILSMFKLGVWLHSLGLLVFGFGFYVLVKAKVMGNLSALKKKASDLAKPDSDGNAS